MQERSLPEYVNGGPIARRVDERLVGAIFCMTKVLFNAKSFVRRDHRNVTG